MGIESRKRAALVSKGVLLIVTLIFAWLGATVANAADCGGETACACGDTMVEDTVLTGHLDSCTGIGLRIVNGNLDCANHQISGTGDADVAGIRLDGTSGSTVQNCRIRNFSEGILIDGGSGNRLADNVIFNNLHGIWLGAGTTDSTIEGNEVRDNRDEGIHLGSGSTLTTVSGNNVLNNGGENLYLLNTTDNMVTGNTLDQSKSAAIFLKNSRDNFFITNQINKRTVHIKGDSSGNVFVGTVMASGGFILQAQEVLEGVWAYPHDTVVTGGSIDASTCFEFLGAYDNIVADVMVDTCKHSEELEYGGLIPFGNQISLIDQSPTDDGQGPSGNGGSASGKLKFNRKNPSRDMLKISYFFTTEGEILPGQEDISLRLSDQDSVVYTAEIPRDSLVERAAVYFRYKDKTYSLIPGLRELQLRHYGDDLWRLSLKATTELDTANTAEMSLSWTIGDDDFKSTHIWRETRRGWRLKN